MPLTIPDTPRAFRATETVVNQFRELMLLVLWSGALAGLLLFAVQHFTLIPLIETAESYETPEHQGGSGEVHEHEGWQRTSLTGLTTVLTGIGFAAILFGTVTFSGRTLNAGRGALWGLAAFACFHLAPALGLPPRPPGAGVTGLYESQLWWAGTALATALGLWLLFGAGRTWVLRLGGVVCLALPHWIGAPAATGQSAVPSQLVQRFAIVSVGTSGMFWLLLGTIGGFIYSRDKVRHR
jgi:cobalt transporter subunit CbtA